ncbi:hypothetical protein HHI36_006212 [Cryptolaemus montrouzieri]|uniref:Protein Wnt n=1 Tax=Cryptolaemus montrouzieri TaxID=559131 RepID=A0ABD2NWJ6_9CUCU
MICTRIVIMFFFSTVVSYGISNKSLSNTSCRKPYYQMVFMNKGKLNMIEQGNISRSCNWLNGCKRERKLCWKKRGLAQVLWNARKLALEYCKSQFRYDQWNCALKMKYFKDIYRETAYMQAIAAASLMYSIAVACSQGQLHGCKCAEHVKSQGGTKWHWGGCSHNIKFARKFAKRFLGIKSNENGLTRLINFNSEIGFRSIQNNIERKCFRVSDSCSVETCWKSLKPFDRISVELKNQYHTAISVNTTNTVNHLNIGNSLHKLMYIKPTLNLCQSTTGRRCNNTDNCATLCCGRGFFSKTIELVYFCNCGWRDQAVFTSDSLVCEQCSKNQNIFVCK